MVVQRLLESAVPILLGATCVYVLTLIIYRLFLSPLAKFPGSKLAAATSWYEFYYDVVKPGCFIWKIKELHEQYGPIVRINPNELHVADPDFYDEIYASFSRKRDKDVKFTDSIDAQPGSSSVLTTAPYDLHRLRRTSLNSYFSSAKVATMQPLMETKVQQFCERLNEYEAQKRVLNLNDGFNALATDIITKFVFGQSWQFLESDDFHGWYRQAVMGLLKGQHTRFHLPWLQRFITMLPMQSMGKVRPIEKFHIDRRKGIATQISQILAHTDKYSMEHTIGSSAHPTLFHTLRDSDSLPDHEKNVDLLAGEASTIVGAASETPSKILATAMYYLVTEPRHMQRVRAELAALQPRSTEPYALPALKDLQQLPYLTGCIKEALRISNAVVQRSARSAPYEDLRYKQYTIPAGILISTIPYFVNFDKTIFPDPAVFEPARWLGDNGKALNHYFVPFSKGARSCLGQNLATAELYITLAAIVPKFDFDLFETTLDDVELRHDFMFAQAKLGSPGIRAYVRARCGRGWQTSNRPDML